MKKQIFFIVKQRAFLSARRVTTKNTPCSLSRSVFRFPLFSTVLLCCVLFFSGCASPMQLLRSWNNDLPPSLAVVYREAQNPLISQRVFSSFAGDIPLQFSTASDKEEELALLEKHAQDALVTALCCQLSRDSDAAAMVEVARNYDQPLIFFGCEPSSAVLDSYDQCWYVGSREREAGELMGQIAVHALDTARFTDVNQNKLIEYVLFTSPQDGSEAALRGEAALSVLENAGYFSALVDTPACAGDALAAYETTLSLLDGGMHTELFLCPNAKEAEGVLRALEERDVLFTVATPSEEQAEDAAAPAPLLQYGVVCIGKTDAVQSLVSRGALLGYISFDESSAAKTILTLARNASLRTNPSDGLDYILEEHRRVYIPYLTETSNS